MELKIQTIMVSYLFLVFTLIIRIIARRVSELFNSY
jgi:hypothetical protein